MNARRRSARHTHHEHRGGASHDEHAARTRICAEAVRILAQEGVRDYQAAKRKAIDRLNLPEGKNLPSNEEIELALASYLQLFHAHRLSADLRRLRQIAVEAMRFLEKFEPRLVGAVLNGTVTAISPVQLHLSADTPEEVGFWLAEHHIPYEQAERRLRFGDDRYETFPEYRFTADGVAVELCVLNRRTARETPLSPVDGRPMKRAPLKEMEGLLRQEGSAPAC